MTRCMTPIQSCKTDDRLSVALCEERSSGTENVNPADERGKPFHSVCV